MTRGAKIVVFSVVGLFVLAGIYYGFLAPKGPTESLADSTPKVSETSTLTLSPTSPSTPLSLTPTDGLPAGSLAGKGTATGAQTGFPAVSGPAFAPSTGGPVGVARSDHPTTVAIDGKPLNPAMGSVPSSQPPVPATALGIPSLPTTPTLPLMPLMPTKKVVTAKATTPSFTVYTVESGDTLTAIAGEWFKDTNKWKEIVAVNPGLNASTLKVGQKINLPARAGSASETMATGTATKTAKAGLSLSNEHVVVSGETLASIADKAYGSRVNWKKIYEANKTVIGENPSALKVGMKLTIPGKQG